jgi:hypothetical protein
MSDLLNRISLDAVKFNNEILACMLIAWIVVLACAMHSVLSQPFNRQQRWFWILLIVCLPGVGLLSYIPFALSKDRPSAYFKRKGRK